MYTGNSKATEADSQCETSDGGHRVCRVADTEQKHGLHTETLHRQSTAYIYQHLAHQRHTS